MRALFLFLVTLLLTALPSLAQQSVADILSANREQIEKAMYRGFTQMMPANATFSVARAVTIQAATDLYGSTSAAVRALTQAWTAVGVN